MPHPKSKTVPIHPQGLDRAMLQKDGTPHARPHGFTQDPKQADAMLNEAVHNDHPAGIDPKYCKPKK
jgi:hypothetical protein